ncbi:UTP--glucose-1-phosphate uridylyltransferase [Actinomycetaceae bacterium TAE3-ERU4]|nr:UTP--glucose-1-phosphate uridylyltransferase [Actinomycetaceae bacterium TAE3-ERU4]
MSAQVNPVEYAVIPAAGRGTRFLPITKSVPKEMLPLVDTPAIEYVVAEAARAGISDVLLVSSKSKTCIEDYFDRDAELVSLLRRDGKDKLADLAERGEALAKVHSVRQGEPLGLGHAVLQAKSHVGDSAFAVLLPDDIMHPTSELLAEMVQTRARYGGSVIALMEVPEDQISAYGNAAVEETEDGGLKVTALKEKPAPGTQLSNYAVVGRYVLDPAVFGLLEHQPTGAGGEIQLTDALATLIDLDPAQGGGVHAVIIKDRRFDTGDKLGYLTANVELALEDAQLGPQLRTWLKSLDLDGNQ